MKNLKFDRARLDAGEMPTRTRNGTKVLKVFDSGLNVELPIAAWLEGLSWPAFFYQPDGRYSSVHPHDLDLVHEPKMRKVRVLVYRNTHGGIGAASEEDAKDCGVSIDDLRTEGRLLHVLEVEVSE